MYMHYITALIEQQMRDDMVKEAFNETLTAKKIVFQPQTANPGDYHVFQVLLTLTIAHSLISYAILLILTAYRYSSLRTARLLLDAILPSLVTMLANWCTRISLRCCKLFYSPIYFLYKVFDFFVTLHQRRTSKNSVPTEKCSTWLPIKTSLLWSFYSKSVCIMLALGTVCCVGIVATPGEVRFPISIERR